MLKACRQILEDVRRQLSTPTADRQLQALLPQLEGLPFELTAGQLAGKPDLDTVNMALREARRVACGKQPAPAACAPRPKETLPSALPVFDVALPKPAQGKIEFASHTSRDGSATLALMTSDREGAARVWIAHSLDGGKNWDTDKYDLPPVPGTTQVILRAVEKRWLVVLRGHENGETLDALGFEGTKLESKARLTLTKGRHFVRVGAIAAQVRAADQSWVVVAVRGDTGQRPLRLHYLSTGDRVDVREPPKVGLAPKIGRAVGLLSEQAPRLLLEDVAPTGFLPTVAGDHSTARGALAGTDLHDGRVCRQTQSGRGERTPLRLA